MVWNFSSPCVRANTTARCSSFNPLHWNKIHRLASSGNDAPAFLLQGSKQFTSPSAPLTNRLTILGLEAEDLRDVLTHLITAFLLRPSFIQQLGNHFISTLLIVGIRQVFHHLQRSALEERPREATPCFDDPLFPPIVFSVIHIIAPKEIFQRGADFCYGTFL